MSSINPIGTIANITYNQGGFMVYVTLRGPDAGLVPRRHHLSEQGCHFRNRQKVRVVDAATTQRRWMKRNLFAGARLRHRQAESAQTEPNLIYFTIPRMNSIRRRPIIFCRT